MNLFPRKKPYRKRKLLSNDEMNLAKANGAHQREERWNQTVSTVKITTVISALVAIPVLFIAWLLVTAFNNPQDLANSVWIGITSLVSFILGKSGLGNIFNGDEKSSKKQ